MNKKKRMITLLTNKASAKYFAPVDPILFAQRFSSVSAYSKWDQVSERIVLLTVLLPKVLAKCCIPVSPM